MALAWLETRIPPPVVMVLAGVLAWALARWLPAFAVDVPGRDAIAIAIAAVGVALNLLPKLAFGRAGTTINPLHPEASTQLVTGGLYRYTRNPMYVGQALVVLAWVVHLGNGAALLAVVFFIAWITRFQIAPEERVLAARFPDAFAVLCRQARRWL